MAGRHNSRRFEQPYFPTQNLQNGRILVAHIDEAGLRLHRPGGYQHALQEHMRRAFKVMAVLEGSRLALVTVDGEIARPFAGTDEIPFPT